jgi:hypothetical protein
MKTYIKSALIAATALANTPALAADFIRYDIRTIGVETTRTQSVNTSTITTVSGYKSYLYSIIVPLSGDFFRTTSEGSFYSTFRTNNFITGSTGISATDTIRFSERPSQASSFASNNITGSLCVDADGRFVTTGFQSNCGSVSRLSAYQFGSTVYDALVFDVRATEGFGVSAAGYGVLTPVALASLVPEISSWIMMIAGFGMVAGAVRYRRRIAKFAYRQSPQISA